MHRNKSCSDTHCRRWVRKLQSEGLDYTIAVLEEIADPTKLAEAECWWIAYGRASGWPLTNIADGGGAYDLAEIRHRLARRLRIACERKAERLRREQRAAAEKVASCRRVKNLRAGIELQGAIACVRAGIQNTSNSEEVRYCLRCFEQEAKAVLSNKALFWPLMWELTHYFVPTQVPNCLECACGYVELVDSLNFDDAAIAKAVDGLRSHIKHASAAERLLI